MINTIKSRVVCPEEYLLVIRAMVDALIRINRNKGSKEVAVCNNSASYCVFVIISRRKGF